MTKTKSQKARKKQAKRSAAPSKQQRRRQAKASSNPPKGGGRQRNRRKRASRGEQYMATDGISHSRVVTNRSSIEDRFSIRREKVADISGSTSAFALQQQLYINPGNSVLFPIFSQIAAPYEQYRVNHLKFYLETEAYTASGSVQTAGIAALGTNFDPDDAAFSTLTQMENYWGVTKGPPYASVMCHDVLSSHKGGKRGGGGRNHELPLNDYFVYSSGNSAAPSNSTSKFYDIGLFQLACANMAAANVIGELYVEYSFTMIHPKQQTPIGQQLLGTHIRGAVGTATTAAPLGTSQTLVAGSNLPVTTTNTTIVMPLSGAGRYLFNINWYTAAANIAAIPAISAGSAFTAVNWWGNNTFDAIGLYNQTSGADSTLNVIYDYVPSATVANNTLTLSGNTSMSGGDFDCYIQQVSSGLSYSVDEIEQMEIDELKDEVRAMKAAILQMQKFNSERYGSPFISVQEEKELLQDAATSSSSSSSPSRYEIEVERSRKNRSSGGGPALASNVAEKQLNWSLLK